MQQSHLTGGKPPLYIAKLLYLQNYVKSRSRLSLKRAAKRRARQPVELSKSQHQLAICIYIQRKVIDIFVALWWRGHFSVCTEDRGCDGQCTVQ
jgi:hypothetical protein